MEEEGTLVWTKTGRQCQGKSRIGRKDQAYSQRFVTTRLAHDQRRECKLGSGLRERDCAAEITRLKLFRLIAVECSSPILARQSTV